MPVKAQTYVDFRCKAYGCWLELNKVILMERYFCFPLFIFDVSQEQKYERSWPEIFFHFWCQICKHMSIPYNTYLTCMYGMLCGMVWPYLQHENMVWYGSMAPLVYNNNNDYNNSKSVLQYPLQFQNCQINLMVTIFTSTFPD